MALQPVHLPPPTAQVRQNQGLQTAEVLFVGGLPLGVRAAEALRGAVGEGKVKMGLEREWVVGERLTEGVVGHEGVGKEVFGERGVALGENEKWQVMGGKGGGVVYVEEGQPK